MADSKQNLKCPACNKDMTKIFVPSEGLNIDICLDGCGGIYFDNRELKYFDEKEENIDEILESISNKVFESVNKELPRSCPVCGVRMVKNHVSIKRTVQIDECYNCGGKFFDATELQSMRDEYENDEERTADVEKFIEETIGDELLAAQKAAQEARNNRSLAKKIFDSYFDKLKVL